MTHASGMRTLSSAALAALLFVGIAVAQTPAPTAGQGVGRGGGPPVQPIQQVRPGLFVVAGAGANSLARVTSDGVILVDGKLPGGQNYDGLMAQIRSITDKPVKFMIVTHHHADHTGNNDRFLAAGVQVVANQNLNKNLESYQFTPRPAMASITYDKEYVVRLGGVAVEAHHFGRSHTSGDTVVYFPDLKVVALSDAVTTGGQGPLIDYAGGGSALEWKRVFDAVLRLDFDAAVPGNGPVLTKADVQAYATKFNSVVDRLTDLVRKGVPKEQLLMQLKTDDIGWTPRIPSFDGLYAELSTR
ncbi:MAG TPA: MBL fold metallo-hydrolase [Vicinamibacterales bacterium]|nr:MBL fold metallo-hydrolase [Vicinamibacterales bacterium]